MVSLVVLAMVGVVPWVGSGLAPVATRHTAASSTASTVARASGPTRSRTPRFVVVLPLAPASYPLTTGTTAPTVSTSTSLPPPVPPPTTLPPPVAVTTTTVGQSVPNSGPWAMTARCEESGRNDPRYGYFGIQVSSWLGYGGGQFSATAGGATWDEQVSIGMAIEGHPPDTGGVCSGGW